MKKLPLFFLYFIISLSVSGQYNPTTNHIDSLLQALTKTTVDTVKYKLRFQLGLANQSVNPNKAVHHFQESLKIAKALDDLKRIKSSLLSLSLLYKDIGEAPKSIEMLKEVLHYSEKDKGSDYAMALAFIGENYKVQGDLVNSLNYTRRAYLLSEENLKNKTKKFDKAGYVAGPLKMGEIFEITNQLDSALYYAQMSYKRVLEKPIPFFYCDICNLLGKIYDRLNQNKTAIGYYHLALSKAVEVNFPNNIQRSQLAIASFYHKTSQPDSAIYYASQAYDGAKKLKGFEVMKQAAGLLRIVYKKQGNYVKALFYSDLAVAARDSITGAEKVREVQNLTHREERRQQMIQQKIEDEHTAFENKVKIYALLAILIAVLLLATILYRNNRQKHKANELLHEQKEEIQKQKVQLQMSFDNLKITQNQLIQAEKLASLGELTAGIAHEIQNPLNFVNNFSELSLELIEEIKQEREVRSEQRDEGLIDELLADLSQNQAKIYHHGKRASSIVSGMLEHSRTSTGERTLTNINKLADEYLRLSYHGMRAKNKDFSADYELIADENLPLINVVPQDIGRVLLNLINNAFYAVNVGEVQNLADVKKVIVTTGHTTGGEPHNQLIIKVIDNGTGISEATKAKIFQPFFTTKPTGEGTGLGLSLSYDIITKGHGGTIEVESVEGEGTTFTVKLPL